MDIAYFDNAATIFPKPNEVYDFMDKFYREYGVNVGRGQYKIATRALDLVSDTRKALLNLFHSPNKKVVFTPSATEAINLILNGLVIPDGANIYTTPFEHNAVTRVLHNLKSKLHINVIELSVDKITYNYNIDEIHSQFYNKKPYLVVMNHASNVCGLITPIFDVAELAKEFNSIVMIDMAQTAGLLDTDLSSSLIDFAVFAGHKTLYGPFGIAGIVSDFKTELSPFMFGGTGVDSAHQDMPAKVPDRFEAGSLNIQAIAGLNAAIAWINKTGIDKIREVENINHCKLIKILEEFPGIKIIGQPNLCDAIGIVSCTFDEYSPDEIGKILDTANVAVRTGLHCSPNAHRFIDTYPAGTVRFSVSYFNENRHFDRLLYILNEIYA